MRSSRERKKKKPEEEEVVVTGDRYLNSLVKFVETHTWSLLLHDRGSLTLKLNPVGLHYVQSRLDALRELEGLLTAAPVDYLRAYVSDLGDHRALEQLRRILRLLPSLKVISLLPAPLRDPTPLSLSSFGRLRVLELRGCDLSTSEARGLLQLTSCLEKLICHNSTDALRHVFASRVVDIKDSLVWKCLSFVSCACNSLLLMDESLQLLPAVETLDLSRNRFTKIDNLKKCTKLQYLDLGFNHLRTISSLREVSCPIVKLILRNNALINLHGIENLKLVEGLDISYNVISTFSELELLCRLPRLKNLWLEGNPISCARWYRAHVFSLFIQSEEFELDGKGIGTREYWEMQAILARRQKKPTGYGFYFPAEDADEFSSLTKRKKKCLRLASIDEEQKFIGPDSFDRESASCSTDHLKKDEHVISDSDVDIADLMNRVEALKKEHSVLWLREFKEWLDKTPDESSDVNPGSFFDLNRTAGPDSSESITDGRLVSELQNQNEQLRPEIAAYSNGNKSPDSHVCGNFECGSMCNRNSPTTTRLRSRRVKLMKCESENCSNDLSEISSSRQFATFGSDVITKKGELMDPGSCSAPLAAIGEVIWSSSTSHYPRSPPHYKDDIIQTFHNLEGTLSQPSSESCSVASSESDTSCSDDDSCRITKVFSRINFLAEDSSAQSIRGDTLPFVGNHCDTGKKDDFKHGADSECLPGILPENLSFIPENMGSDDTKLDSDDNIVAGSNNNVDMDQFLYEASEGKNKWKTKRRVISILPEDPLADKILLSKQSNEVKMEAETASFILDGHRDTRFMGERYVKAPS